jgi:hypothetical protein
MSADSKPWFAPQIPWAFWGPPSPKKMINNGTPPQAFLWPNEEDYGFSIYGGQTIGSNLNGALAIDTPATVGNVLNLSAAAMGSSGAFNTRGRPNQ